MEQTSMSLEELFLKELEGQATDTPQKEPEFTLEVPAEEAVTTEEAEEEEEKPVQIFPTEENYDTFVQELIESGDWDGEYVIEDEEGNEVKLSEMKGVDKETFKSIKELIKAEKDKEIKENFIEVKNLTETQKALINIVKSGDLDKARELFEDPTQLQEPFKGYDSGNEKHNEMVLTAYYQQQGFSQKKIETLIKASKEDLTLDTEAEQIVNKARTDFKKQFADLEKKAAEEKKLEEENRKVYRKDVSTIYKTDYNFPDTLVKKLVDATTKPEEDGELLVDKVYEKYMKDPKEAAEVALFLLNREEYKNRVKAPVKKEEQLNTYKKLKIVKDTAKTSTKQKEEQPEGNFLEQLTFN
jgi:hypothetical protein